MYFVCALSLYKLALSWSLKGAMNLVFVLLCSHYLGIKIQPDTLNQCDFLSKFIGYII